MSILNKIHDLVAAAGQDVGHLVHPQQQQGLPPHGLAGGFDPGTAYGIPRQPLPTIQPKQFQPMAPLMMLGQAVPGTEHQYIPTPGTANENIQEDSPYVAAPHGIMPLSSVNPGEPWRNLWQPTVQNSDSRIVNSIDQATGYPRGVDPALFGYPADNTVTNNLPLYLKRR